MEDISAVKEEFSSDTEIADEIENTDENSKTGEVLLYLTFSLGKDFFGIPVNTVREVIEYKKVFKTPRVPGYIKGVINLRGEVVPVIDLSSRFYNITSSIINTSAIVIVEVEENYHKVPIGVIIDSVKAVVELNDKNIDTIPEIGSKIKPEYLSGIGKVDNEFVILLNIERILNIDELSEFEDYNK
jgi:purine-binding chemotaxis protein CheW